MTRDVDPRAYYETPGVGATYREARTLPAETERQWADEIRRVVGSRTIRVAADVGAGTGRFTACLVEALAPAGRGRAPRGGGPLVIAIERALAMMEAREPEGAGGVLWVRADGAALPLRSGAADLLTLSMVYHHFGDAAATARGEFRRALARDGLLLLRTPTQETLDEFEWARFFPETRAFNADRMPARARAIAEFEASGFHCREHRVVRQRIARTLGEYVARIRHRPFSSMQAMADDVWARRLAEFEAHCAGRPDAPVDEPVDLFVFRSG